MNVGDYVRTKDGYIGKAIIITEYVVNIENKKIVEIKDIIESSPNIIDLIEVGDYVNGEKVIYINEKYEYLEVSDEYVIIKKEDIKSIVTHQQFEQVEYKL